MTVLHLLGSPGDGGAETYFLHLVEALHAAGVDQAAAIHANAGREQALARIGVAAHVLPFGAPFDFVTAPRIRRLARVLPARVMLQWMNRAGRVSPGRGPWGKIGRLGGYYDLKYYRDCDLLVGNTRDIVDHIVRQGWPAERTVYVPNFATPGVEPALPRAELDTAPHAPLWLAMGRLHEAKAHDVSLKALALAPDAVLWIAGSGPQEATLKALAKRLGVAERVRFLGWRNDPSALYRAADVCVFPSRYEPLGNTVIQAWAHDVPIVAAAAQGPAGLIRTGADGLLVPIDDPEALAAATARVTTDPNLAARLIQAGRARIAHEFDKVAVVAQWRELFARFGEG
jgi:glycosyltransferase involved in cell wall biosynthesis